MMSDVYFYVQSAGQSLFVVLNFIIKVIYMAAPENFGPRSQLVFKLKSCQPPQRVPLFAPL